MTPSNENREMTQNERWQELARQAQGGDKRAYNALLKELVPFIKSVISGTLANQDWADDITQEVLISVHKSLHTYSATRPFRPWLMAIISFRKTDFLRRHYSGKRDKQTTLEDPSFLSSHVTNPVNAGELKDIEAALATLPEKQRRVFELLKIRGYSAKEVAGQTGMSVTAVKVSAHRAMNKLKDKLQ